MSDFINSSLNDDNFSDSNNAESFFKKDDAIRVIFHFKDQHEEILVPRFKIDPKNIVDRSIILFGRSNSGKTTILKDIMYNVKDEFSVCIVFAPTNPENKTYDGIVPDQLIYEDLSLKVVKEIYTRQKFLTELYNNSNNLQILHSLFERIGSPKARKFLRQMFVLKEKAIQITKDQTKDFNVRGEKIIEIEKTYKNKLIKFYKYTIKQCINKLKQISDLKEEEKLALEYLDISPNILIVFDDALTDLMKLIKEGQKKNDQVIKNFFFKARHAHITHAYCLQTDKIDTDIRRNAMMLIFSEKETALSFFTKAANNFSLIERKKAEAVINAIFTRENEEKKLYRKLVYSNLDKNKFSYIIAAPHEQEEFTMCSNIVRLFCKKIGDNENKFDTSNPYFHRFKENINY